MTAPVTSPGADVLAVEHATVLQGGNRILDDVSLHLREGELVALLGANGSGKSTLLRAVVGALPLASGSASLFGTDVTRRHGHRRMGYVPQYAAEGGNIAATATETVATGLLGVSRRLSGLISRAKDPRVHAALADLGMLPLADRPVTQMSGGQRQRVMIARALVRSPELLVLDEPFSGVDLATQKILAQLIGRLVSRGTTVLVVLHDLGLLTDSIDRAIVLDHGRVVHDGDPRELPHLAPGHDHDPRPAPDLGQELDH